MRSAERSSRGVDSKLPPRITTRRSPLAGAPVGGRFDAADRGGKPEGCHLQALVGVASANLLQGQVCGAMGADKVGERFERLVDKKAPRIDIGQTDPQARPLFALRGIDGACSHRWRTIG